MSDKPNPPSASDANLVQEVVISEQALQKAEEFIEAERGGGQQTKGLVGCFSHHLGGGDVGVSPLHRLCHCSYANTKTGACGLCAGLVLFDVPHREQIPPPHHVVGLVGSFALHCSGGLPHHGR